MMIIANIVDKSWTCEYESVVPYNQRNSIDVEVTGLDSVEDKNPPLNFAVSAIKGGSFYKSELFPKGLTQYESDTLSETITISAQEGDTLEIHAWLRVGEVFFENTLSLVVENFEETTEALDPNPKLLAKKDYRSDNFKEAKRLMDKENSKPDVDKL